MESRNAASLRIASLAWSLLIVGLGARAQEAASQNTYPVHGKVVAAHLGISNTAGNFAGVASWKKWVYRVNCGDLYYDLQGEKKPSLTIGQEINFRIEKEKAYMKDATNVKKENKYNIVGLGKLDSQVPPS